jgi:hypothetical protein
MNYQTWIEKQCHMAQSLESGSLGGTYADGAIILCSALGAMSFLRWRPTPKTDRKRFIEIVARCRAGGPDATRISTVLLAEEHSAFGRIEHSRYLWEQDDKTEAEAIAIATAAGITDCTKKSAATPTRRCYISRCAAALSTNTSPERTQPRWTSSEELPK